MWHLQKIVTLKRNLQSIDAISLLNSIRLLLFSNGSYVKTFEIADFTDLKKIIITDKNKQKLSLMLVKIKHNYLNSVFYSVF